MAPVVVQEKRCPRCGLSKSVGNFHRNAKARDGLFSWCKICQWASQKAWRQSPKGKAYYQRPDVQDKLREKRKRYAARNPEKMAARDAVRIAKHLHRLPRPSTVKCRHCGKKAHSYHHHKGYAPEHHLDVIPLCKRCHMIDDGG